MADDRLKQAAEAEKKLRQQLKTLREIRKRGGREAAQAVAGHSRATMTDHYAPANWSKATRAALTSG